MPGTTVRAISTQGDLTLLSSLTASSSPAVRLGLQAGAVIFATALTAVAAQISIPLPLTPVPLTLQPMVVLLAGAVLGSRLGAGCQFLYLAAGVAGLPVFAASPVLLPGVARLLGPTGGYLLSYPLAAWLVGALTERGFDRRYATALLAMTAGLLVIFAIGVPWLAWFALPPPGAGFDTVRPGLRSAIQAGLYPFILLDLVKLLFAAAALPACRKLTGRLS